MDDPVVNGETPPAVSVCAPEKDAARKLPHKLSVLAKRRDFLLAARARRQGTPAMMIQARNRRDDSDTVRVGFTCSKKVGNAVARNRAKRRMREVARLVLPLQAKPGWDYVLIGRKDDTATRNFEALQSDLSAALKKLHAPHKKRPPRD